jgi:biotin carboxyl carrier protein
MVGSVWRVDVTPGQAVAADERLLALEVMKMEIPVEAPRAGRVVAVHVAQGQLVEEGQPLVTLGM